MLEELILPEQLLPEREDNKLKDQIFMLPNDLLLYVNRRESNSLDETRFLEYFGPFCAVNFKSGKVVSRWNKKNRVFVTEGSSTVLLLDNGILFTFDCLTG